MIIKNNHTIWKSDIFYTNIWWIVDAKHEKCILQLSFFYLLIQSDSAIVAVAITTLIKDSCGVVPYEMVTSALAHES